MTHIHGRTAQATTGVLISP